MWTCIIALNCKTNTTITTTKLIHFKANKNSSIKPNTTIRTPTVLDEIVYWPLNNKTITKTRTIEKKKKKNKTNYFAPLM